MNTVCCIYCYFEKNELYKSNFIYFLSNAILDNVDYYICISGDCSVNLNDYNDKQNINFIFKENKGYDFGGYSYLFMNNMIKSYEYYFFINTSVKGPLLKEGANKDWTIPFINLFNKDNVKLVGTSINTAIPYQHCKEELRQLHGNKNVFSHVQSMFFCLKHDYLTFLLENDFFNYDRICSVSFDKIINIYELGLSQIALNNNWNINSILSKYKDLDYSSINTNINPSADCYHGDPYFNNSYFYGTIDPYEVIFFKNSRF